MITLTLKVCSREQSDKVEEEYNSDQSAESEDDVQDVINYISKNGNFVFSSINIIHH